METKEVSCPNKAEAILNKVLEMQTLGYSYVRCCWKGSSGGIDESIIFLVFSKVELKKYNHKINSLKTFGGNIISGANLFKYEYYRYPSRVFVPTSGRFRIEASEIRYVFAKVDIGLPGDIVFAINGLGVLFYPQSEDQGYPLNIMYDEHLSDDIFVFEG